MEETAFHWIRRRKAVYDVKPNDEDFDVSRVEFVHIASGPSYACLCRDNRKESVFINLATPEDCEMLCKLLRVTPVITE